MQILSVLILSIFSVLLPVYLWSFIASYYTTSHNALRLKLLFWIISGGISVVSIWGFTKYFFGSKGVFEILYFLLFLSIFGICIYFLSSRGSKYAKLFLRKISLYHFLVFLGVFILLYIATYICSKDSFISVIITTLLLPALYEETSKHISMLGGLSKNFSFSRADITLYTLCTTLGFVIVENIVYILSFHISLSDTIWRMVFLLAVHLSAALVCSLTWWKALSYKFLSWKYIAYFVIGFLSALCVHTLYNYAITHGFRAIAWVYAFMAYGLFVYGMHAPDHREKI